MLEKLLASETMNVARIQEPWLVGGKVSVLNNSRDKLTYNTNSGSPRTCIFINHDLNYLVLNEFCNRDITAVKLYYHTGAGAAKEVVMTSAYLLYDSPSPLPSEELVDLENFCR